jgi:hypothetical protein
MIMIIATRTRIVCIIKEIAQKIFAFSFGKGETFGLLI